MKSSNKIIETLVKRLVLQEVINDSLIEILVESDIVGMDMLKERINSNIKKSDTLSYINEKKEDTEKIPYFGEAGQA